MLISLKIKLLPNFSQDPLITMLDGLSIKGQIKKKDLPTICYVRLYEKSSGRLVLQTITNEEGFYEFNHLTYNKFFIIASDSENTFNAVIQDNVIPK